MTNSEPGAGDYTGGATRYTDQVGGGGPTARGTDDRSIGEIVGAITNDLSKLVRQELDLAKTEAKREAVKAGRGVGMLGGAGIAAHLTLLFLSGALMFLLDIWMPLALAALIVAVLWGIVAAVLALRGKKDLQELSPPMETTQQTLKEDVQWAKDMKNR
jgi:hypothetical protein